MGGRAELINLRGRAVIPALTDAHVHFVNYALARRNLRLDGVADFDAAIERVRAVMCLAIEGERLSAVVRRLKGFPAVDRIYTTNGRWDLVAELDVANLAEFSRALDDIRTVEGIAMTETSILLASV